MITWLFSGTRSEYLFPMFAVSLICYFCYWASKGGDSGLDKVLNYVLFLLIVVCVLQYVNPSAQHVVDEHYSYIRSLEHIAYLPTSVSGEYFRGNALSSLVSIATALCSFIVFLYVFERTRHMNIILLWFIVNALGMGIVGCIQEYLNIPIIYNVYYTTAIFFGSFPLSNAAGAFLNLAVSVSVYIALSKIKSKWGLLYVLFGTANAVLLSFAVFKTDSNIAIASNFIFWMVILFFCIIRLSMFLSKKTSKTFIIATWIFVCSVVVITFPSNDEFCGLKAKACEMAKNRSFEESFRSRLTFYKLSYELINRRPIFGYGGDSCRYVLSLRLQKIRDKTVARLPHSIVHSHSDIIEYVLEYGVVGLVAILAILTAWVFKFFKRKINLPQIVLFTGIFMCILHSCIDMHLHIPSTMIELAMVMAVAVSSQYER